MINIAIETISHNKQRYNTIGDWQFINPEFLHIRVSDLKDNKMNCLVAIHELVEATLCKFNDPEITTEQVDTFDISHPELEEPGLSLDCPYMIQHLVASNIEKMIADRLKVDWDEYEKRIREL